MRTREKERFLKKLLEMKEEILREINHFETNQRAGVKDTDGEVSTYTTHPADMSSMAQEREKAFMLASHERKLLDSINNAIERINTDKYGKCLLCGNKLNVERLKLLPYSELCLECKKEQERSGIELS